MSAAKSFFLRLLTMIIHIPVQIAMTTVYNIILLLMEIVPMIGMYIGLLIGSPFIMIAKVFSKCCGGGNWGECRMGQGDGHPVIIILIFIGMLLVLGSILAIMSVTFGVALIIISFALFIPKQVATCAYGLFDCLGMKTLRDYCDWYAENHTNIDYSIVNLFIFPVLLVIALIATLIYSLIEPWRQDYKVIRSCHKIVKCIFDKSNGITFAYMEWKSGKEYTSPIGHPSKKRKPEVPKEQKHWDGESVIPNIPIDAPPVTGNYQEYLLKR